MENRAKATETPPYNMSVLPLQPLPYAVFLASALSVLFLLGFGSQGGSEVVQPYPTVLSLLVVPLVFGVALRNIAKTGKDPKALRREGRQLATWSSALFGGFVGAFLLGLYWQPQVGYGLAPAAFGACVAFITTWLLGAGSASGWASVWGAPSVDVPETA